MKRIRIGYYCADVNPKKTISLGIYKTTKEILRQLLKNKSLDILLILSDENKEYFREFKCKKRICRSKSSGFLKKVFIYPYFANKVAKDKKLDLLFFPKGHIPLIKIRGPKYVSIIHDLIPLKYLRIFKPSSLVIPFLLWWSAKGSDLIFTDSNYSKKEIMKISNRPVEVIPLGYRKVSPKDPHFEKEYIFIVGNKNKHKNLEKSIRLLEEYNLKNQKNYLPITSPGKLSEQELAGLYKHAKCSIFLSDIEGFGLPLIESYSHLTPVVFNNKTSLAEIGHGLPGACDVNNEESVFRAIKEIENLPKNDIKKIAKILLDRYNWNLCGLTIYNRIHFLMTSSSK